MKVDGTGQLLFYAHVVALLGENISTIKKKRGCISR